MSALFFSLCSLAYDERQHDDIDHKLTHETHCGDAIQPNQHTKVEDQGLEQIDKLRYWVGEGHFDHVPHLAEDLQEPDVQP